MATKKKFPTRTVVKIAVCTVVLFVLLFFMGMPGLNERVQEINIKTGQKRYSYTILFMNFNKRVEDSLFSTALDGEVIDVADIDSWQKVNTFTPGSHVSPHWMYHSAFHNIGQVKTICAEQPDPTTCTEELAREVMARWQDPVNNGTARDLLLPLWLEVVYGDQSEGDSGSD